MLSSLLLPKSKVCMAMSKMPLVSWKILSAAQSETGAKGSVDLPELLGIKRALTYFTDLRLSSSETSLLLLYVSPIVNAFYAHVLPFCSVLFILVPAL